jgi:prepilin-type N-terminal cleavage/methylation domain-containing protein
MMKNAKILRTPDQTGFTLVELLLAMAIFSFMLLIMSAGVIRLIHFYQATLDVRATQQAAREVSDDLTEAARQSSLITVSNVGPAYGGQPESAVCFFSSLSHNADSTITGSGIAFYAQQTGTYQWTIYQVAFSGLTSNVTGSGSCTPPSGGAEVTSTAVSFIRFGATTTPDNRLVQFEMVIAGSSELTPVTNIDYTALPLPTCSDGNNDYCSITNLQVAAEAREPQS